MLLLYRKIDTFESACRCFVKRTFVRKLRALSKTESAKKSKRSKILNLIKFLCPAPRKRSNLSFEIFVAFVISSVPATMRRHFDKFELFSEELSPKEKKNEIT